MRCMRGERENNRSRLKGWEQGSGEPGGEEHFLWILAGEGEGQQHTMTSRARHFSPGVPRDKL